MTTAAPTHQPTLKALAVTLGAIAALSAVSLGAIAISGGFTSSAFASSTAPPNDWDPILEEYISFIEEERGLTFEHPVHLRFADIAAEVAEGFEEARRLEEQFESNAFETPDPYGDAYHLLGLVDFDPNLDSQESLEASIIENAGAFYDPNALEIVLPEGEPIVKLQLTLVHELTHALQHQNGMLDLHLDTADSSQARLALIEGDAERIAVAWFTQLSDTEQLEYFDAIGEDNIAAFDDPGNSYLDATFFVSYGLGPPLVLSIIETDGVDELNRLLRSSDVGSTERFVDLLGSSSQQSVDAFVEFDPPDGRSEADGDLGALAWFAVLAPVVGSDGAFDALVGYDDDAFAIYEGDSGAVCGRFELFFDTAGEAIEFALLAARAGIEQTVRAEQRVSADICEQIGEPENQRLATLFPLVIANELILNHLLMGEAVDVARCAALAQAKQFPIDQPLDDFVGYDALFVESEGFVNACR